MYNGHKRIQIRKWTSIVISVVTQYEYRIEFRMKPESDVAFMFAFSSRNLNSEAAVALTSHSLLLQVGIVALNVIGDDVTSRNDDQVSP